MHISKMWSERKLRREGLCQPLETRLPSDRRAGAYLGRTETGVPERDARSPVEPLQFVRHGRRCGRRSDAVPRVHELSRRIDLKEFTFERVRLAAGDAGGAPPPSSVNIARPLPRIKDTGPDPPIC